MEGIYNEIKKNFRYNDEQQLYFVLNRYKKLYMINEKQEELITHFIEFYLKHQ